MKHSELKLFKEKGQKITCLTSYDASMTRLIDSAGVDLILVGDSLGMVIQGEQNTKSVAMEDMIYHTAIVSKASQQSLVVADMPIHSYDNVQSALLNAKELLSCGAGMIKIEGGSENTEVIKAFISNNIKVCGHLGLQPQQVVDSSGYKVQGRDKVSADSIKDNAKLLESLGISALVLECIPSDLAGSITNLLTIPTIGIGAGKECDGQILVSYDMLGISLGKQPRFVRNFLTTEESIIGAFKSFVVEVQQGKFPNKDESY